VRRCSFGQHDTKPPQQNESSVQQSTVDEPCAKQVSPSAHRQRQVAESQVGACSGQGGVHTPQLLNTAQ
jgi:hypothetical protein